MKTRAPADLVGGASDMNSTATRALLAERQIWRATADEDGQYLFVRRGAMMWEPATRCSPKFTERLRSSTGAHGVDGSWQTLP